MIDSVREAIATRGDAVPTQTDITTLLTDSNLDLDDFFSYNGSLTTPPCTEGIKWNVLNRVLPISTEQLEEFTTLLADDPAFAGGNGNNRVVQPVNGRALY